MRFFNYCTCDYDGYKLVLTEEIGKRWTTARDEIYSSITML